MSPPTRRPQQTSRAETERTRKRCTREQLFDIPGSLQAAVGTTSGEFLFLAVAPNAPSAHLDPPQYTPSGPVTPDSSANSHSVSSTSTAQTWPPPPMLVTSSESGDSYRSQSQTSQGDGDERRNSLHVTLQSLHQTSRNTSPISQSPQADSSAPMYSSGSSSPVILVPPEVPEAGPQVSLSYPYHEPSNDPGSATPFLTPDAPTSIERCKSYDDGTRPLNVLFKNGAPPPNSSLSVRLPNNRASKRNSINPGTTFNYEAVAVETNSKSLSAPQSPLSFLPLAPDAGQASSPGATQRLPPREQASEALSRRPSRKGHAETPASAPDVAGSMLRRSRSRTETSPKLATGIEPMGPPPRHNTMLEHLPPRTHSLLASTQDPELMVRRQASTASMKNRAPRRSTSDDKDKPKPGFPLSIDVEKSRAGYGMGINRPMSPAYKAASPSHKVDVPHGIESGTDTSDGEHEPSAKERTQTSSLPSKDKEAKSRRRTVQLGLNAKQSPLQEDPGETSLLSIAGDVDSEDESSPVERMSRSTFIAPAHPPIRFSVSGNGFQELLSQVDPRDHSSLHVIEELGKIGQNAEAHPGASQSTLNLRGSAAQDEGRGSSTPASALTPTFGSSPIADNSSATTISAPSSQGHSDSFMILDPPETTKGAESELLLHLRGTRNALLSPSSRSSSERSRESPTNDYQHARLDSNAAAYHIDASSSEPSPYFTVTAPDSSVARPAKLDPSYGVAKRLQDALQDAVRRGLAHVSFDQEFVQTVVMMVEQRRDENAVMKGRPDHIKVRAPSLTYPSY